MRSMIKMGMKIESECNRYKISIGTGKTFYARNVEEIHKGVDHYFGHTSHKGVHQGCPFCRDKNVQNL